MLRVLREAVEAGNKGAYGVAAVLANTRGGLMSFIHSAQNGRIKGGEDEYTGHAETLLVRGATQYLQSGLDHKHIIAAANLCPCPGCMGPLIDSHIPKFIVGSIDPEVGAAFLQGEALRYAVGAPRQQVIKNCGLKYRFPHIPDKQTRDLILALCWHVFHTTRKPYTGESTEKSSMSDVPLYSTSLAICAPSAVSFASSLSYPRSM